MDDWDRGGEEEILQAARELVERVEELRRQVTACEALDGGAPRARLQIDGVEALRPEDVPRERRVAVNEMPVRAGVRTW
ncbi:hypothetical protein ACWDRB_46625 [Nonomuraea sp. NPDC003707]